MALVEWSDNIKISDQPPAEYWPAQLAQKGPSAERLVVQRRQLMGIVVRDAFAKPTESSSTPAYPHAEPAFDHLSPETEHVTVADLVDADLLPAGTTLVAAGNAEIAASVLGDGRIAFGGQTYDTLADAAVAVSGASPNSWTYWVADLATGHYNLSSLREAFCSTRTGS